MSDSIVRIENLMKSFGDKTIYNGYNLKINRGEFILITGPSGCGKSTLLNIIGLLDKADSGFISLFDYEDVKPFSKKAELLLKEKIGYLFQNYALIDNETVYNNLKFLVKKNPREEVSNVLSKVGLIGYENKKIYQCSGGEQQRVAIARLMLKSCELILADEPTGSLDEDNKKMIMNLLKSFHNNGKTIVMVTHDLSLKEYATRIIEL